MGGINRYEQQFRYIHDNKMFRKHSSIYNIFKFEHELFLYEFFEVADIKSSVSYSHFVYITFHNNNQIKIKLHANFDKTIITKIENFLARKLYYYEKYKMD